MNAYREAIKIYSAFPDVDLSSLLANLGNIYSNCQMYSVAEKYYHEAINERRNKNPNGKELLYQIYRQLSLAQEQLGTYEEALNSLNKALEIAEQGFGNIIEVLFHCAKIKELEENWLDALEFY